MSQIQENQLSVFEEEEWDLESVIKNCVERERQGFYICNLSDLIKKFELWLEKMPNIKPFYAVKCNDDIMVLKLLSNLGCGFDCASKNEIEKILNLGVSPDRIIFANTTKIDHHIEFAEENNVNTLTFDNEDEIYKILKFHPKANLILRIRYSSDKAIYKLGKKFGCEPNHEAIDLLKITKKLNLSVIGLSFHIGSSCQDFDVYCNAIRACRKIFDQAKEELGYHFKILDIGGGFPGEDFETINIYSDMINQTIKEEFPVEKFPDLKTISEPGTYFVKSAFTLMTQIHSRKFFKKPTGEIEHVMYYLNEGVYSSFLFVPLGPEVIEPSVLLKNQSDEKYSSTLWGPTCDSTDKVCENIQLEKLEINDWIYFINMGAYTIPLRTPFNSFPYSNVRHYILKSDMHKIKASLECSNKNPNLLELINGKLKQFTSNQSKTNGFIKA